MPSAHVLTDFGDGVTTFAVTGIGVEREENELVPFPIGVPDDDDSVGDLLLNATLRAFLDGCLVPVELSSSESDMSSFLT